MTTFAFVFHVKPTSVSARWLKANRGHATVLVMDAAIGRAERVAREYLTRHQWEICGVEKSGVETAPDDYSETPEGQGLYIQAQTLGIAAVISCVAADSDTLKPTPV